MVITKGKSDIEAERDLVILGFKEQINCLKDAFSQQKAALKAQLDYISPDSNFSIDEISAIERPHIEELQDIQEKHTRIRRTILIGIYSLWELSLKYIKDTKSLQSFKNDTQPSIIENKRKSIAWNYLNVIYNESIPSSSLSIDDSVRILRNYMVHGRLSEDHLCNLRKFALSHSNLHLIICNKECDFSNYDGLLNLLDIISRELNSAESEMCKSNILSK